MAEAAAGGAETADEQQVPTSNAHTSRRSPENRSKIGPRPFHGSSAAYLLTRRFATLSSRRPAPVRKRGLCLWPAVSRLGPEGCFHIHAKVFPHSRQALPETGFDLGFRNSAHTPRGRGLVGFLVQY